jgi:hypothetical protein
MQAGSGSAVHDGSGLPPATQDANHEDVQNTRQEKKPVTATATVLANANDAFEYKVGNPHFHGRTIVRVTGNGNVEASFERGGKIQSYKGTVPPAKLKALRNSLAKHPIDKYQPAKRSPVPDEATMEFTLVTGGVRAQATYLDNARHEVAALDELVDVIQEIASKVSKGKIEY